jgi:hypothetical protein
LIIRLLDPPLVHDSAHDGARHDYLAALIVRQPREAAS